jgi:hypothetical protein
MPIPIQIRIRQNEADSTEAFGVPVIKKFRARILLARNFLTRYPDPVFAPYPDEQDQIRAICYKLRIVSRDESPIMQRPLYQGCWPPEGEDRRTGEAGRKRQWETHLGGQVSVAYLKMLFCKC